MQDKMINKYIAKNHSGSVFTDNELQVIKDGNLDDMVTTFLGRVPDKNVEENLEIVKEVWPPILEYA